MKDGNAKSVGVTITAAVPGGMGGATGILMAIGLQLFNSGKIKDHGVFAPEQVIDPDVFFNELAPLCAVPSPRANGEELLLITVS